jgi:AcrR family transcriptional regulator
VRAARDVFSELGYDAATFQAIAIRADLTRPAINHYFANKQVLWREVVEQTNSLVVSASMARAHGETGLLGRLSAFFSAAMQAESQDRSAAAFLVTSVLEAQRHPELSHDGHDSLKNSRAFVSWAVNDAIERGELTLDSDIDSLVEMLVAVMWGMGFYAGFVGEHEDLAAIVHKFELLMANKLWQLNR